MANLKQGTLDMCKKAQQGKVCVRSVDQELGGLSFLADVRFLPHSWLACAAVVADILTGRRRARSIFIDQNLAGVGGYTQTLRLIQVIWDLTLEGDSVTDGQRAAQKLFFLEHRHNKRQILLKRKANIIPSPPSAEDLIQLIN